MCTSVHIDPSLALAEDADLTEEVSSPAFAFAGNMRSPSSLPRANDCNMAGERGGNHRAPPGMPNISATHVVSLKMIFRHPNCHHTYPKTESLRYSLAFSHNSYSYPLILLVLYT